MKVTISVGKSRKETRWKIRTVEWSKLVDKFRETVRTAESEIDYRNATKDRKSEIKDIGGFVGGAVEGGRRIKGSVRKRSLLTLDIDYAVGDVWDDVTMYYTCAMVLYSTHSHTHDKPRYRLIIPLDRTVTPEEHEAIARRVADTIGIDMFDDSTYQAERLMFWASTPRDGEYVFREQEGAPMCADEILSEYHDWRDISQWATSSRTDIVSQRMMAKKGEPNERPGAVGAFCRAYTISEAIDEFLSDVYSPVANDDNRYTYMQGSSAGGLVVYDDKFAYSHHATDPASEQMCNAFDLVRVHKFGSLDEDVKDDTPINRMPSYIEMEAFVYKDAKVVAERSSSIQQSLHEDFGELYEESTDKEDDSWMGKLDCDKNHGIKSTAGNILLILNNAQGLKNNIRRNDFTHTDEVLHDLPWRKVRKPEEKEWGNDDDARLRVYLENYYNIQGKEKIQNCFTEITTSHRYHPIRDYLNGLTWDGEQRAETLLIDYLGAEDTPLNRMVTRKFLAAAVARVFNPGIKYDYVTVLQGEQGIGKSTLLSRLAGESWFNDSMTDLSGKDAMEILQGSWIIELGELQAIKRSEIESVKSFISRQIDAYRPAYGRVRENHPRQCVFFATTNEDAFLKGNEGNRRFWVVPCSGNGSKSVFDISSDIRNQIWAEAVLFFREGEKLYLEREYETEMRKIQENYNELQYDERLGKIEEYLNKKLPPDWNNMSRDQRIIYLADDEEIERRGTYLRDRVCILEIITECLGERTDDKTSQKVKSIRALMRRIPGWEKTKTGLQFGNPYGYQRGYIRIEDEQV